MARHGGRDKTCATLRLHYSWVPKELTAKFVKACPTCTLKRSGNPDLLSQFGQAVHSYPQPLPPYAPQVLPSPLPAVESALLFPGGPNDSPPSFSFVVGVGSAGCDEANGGGGGGGCGTGFGPSIFATPDLSVYPSPTLSTGSLGPMTPSPYLPGGLFGYPAVFDPGHGHGSLSSVSGWDPSPLSPCVPMMYAEELRAGTPMYVQPVRVDEIIDMRARGMQLHLPTPKAVRAMHARVQSCGGDGDGDGHGVSSFSGVVDTPCPADMSNIDPVLLAEGGYPSLTLIGPPARTVADATTDSEVDADADADMETCAGSGGEPPYFHDRASTWETPTPVVGATGYPISMQGLTVTPGRPLPPPHAHAALANPTSPAVPPPPLVLIGAPVSRPMSMHMPMPIPAAAVPRARRGRIVLSGGRGADADAEDATEVVETVDVEDVDVDEVHRMRMPFRLPVEDTDTRWDRPEAWLVQSDSMDDARSI
jgi:hypothetical protein